MTVICPSCGAENQAQPGGQQVVCAACFHMWVPAAGVGSEIDLGSAGGEFTFDLDGDMGADPVPVDDSTRMLPLEAFEEVPAAYQPETHTAETPFEGVGRELEGMAPAYDMSAGEYSGVASDDPYGAEHDPGEPQSALQSSTGYRRSLSESEMVMIGPYRRRSGEMAHAVEDVYAGAPKSQPQQRPQTQRNPQAFGGQDAGWGDPGVAEAATSMMDFGEIPSRGGAPFGGVRSETAALAEGAAHGGKKAGDTFDFGVSPGWDGPGAGDAGPSTQVYGSAGADGGDNPFNSMADPFAVQGATDMFGAGGADPFGSGTAGEKPWDRSGESIFGGGGGGGRAAPGGGSGTESFGGADPFGGGGGGGGDTGSDPFSWNPFAEGGHTDGGANPFDAPAFETGHASPFGGNEERTMAMPAASAHQQQAGTAQTMPSGRAADPRQDSAFFVDGAGAGVGGGPAQSYGTDGPAQGETGTFEVDIPGSGAPQGPMDGPAPRRRPAARRRARGGGRRGLKQSKSKKPKVLLAVLGLLVVGGLALGATDLGFFGIDAIMGNSSPTSTPLAGPLKPGTNPKVKPGAGGPGATAEAPIKGPAPVPKRPGDAPEDYLSRIGGMQAALSKKPDDGELRVAYATALLMLQERYPNVFTANPAHAETLAQLLTPDLRASNQALKVWEHMANGDLDEAQAVMDGYVTESKATADELYLMGHLALRRGRLSDARRALDRALEQAPGWETALFDLGRSRIDARNYAGARESFEAIAKANPKHAPARLALAEVAIHERKYPEAEQRIDAVLKEARATKNNDSTFRSYRVRAAMHEAQGDRPAQQRALEQALGARRQDEKTAIELAGLLSRDKPNDALQVLQTCKKEGCNSPTFYRRLVLTYLDLGHERNAQSQLRDAMRLHKDDAALHMLAGEMNERANQPENAKSKYAAVIGLDPTYAEAYLKLSDLQWRENQYKKASDTLESGIEHVKAKRGQLMERLAKYQMAMGSTLAAKETMKRILELDPNKNDVKRRFAVLLKQLGFLQESLKYFADLEAAGSLEPEQLVDYAEVLFKMKRYEESLGKLEAAAGGGHENLDAYVLRGALYIELKQYADADTALQTALKINPDHAKAYHYLGLNELAQKDLKTATDYLAKAVDLAADDLSIRHDLARALTHLGGIDNRRRALAEYSYIIRMYETMKTAIDRKQINAAVFLERGHLYYDNGTYKKALADFEMAMNLDKSNEEVLVQYAKALRKDAREGEAENYLNHVLSQDPKNPAAHFYLGLICLRGKRSLKAIEHFNAAVANGGANFPEAHRYLGYLYRERNLGVPSCSEFKQYLRVADKDRAERHDVRQMIRRFCGGN